MAEHNLGHELTVIGNGSVPRPEEDRLTQAEKNERLNQQLKVSTLQQHSFIMFLWFILVVDLSVCRFLVNSLVSTKELHCDI